MTGKDSTPQTRWIKASRSGQGGDCVEMRRDGEAVNVRDSKDPHGGMLAVPPAQFTAWLDAARRGEFPADR